MPRANSSLKNRLSFLLLAAAIACCFSLPPAFGQGQTAPGNNVEWWNKPVGPAGAVRTPEAVRTVNDGRVSVVGRASSASPAGVNSSGALTRRRSKRRSGVTLADPVHTDDLSLGLGSEPSLLNGQADTIFRNPAGAETPAPGYLGYNSGFRSVSGTAHAPLARQGSAGLRSTHIIHPDSLGGGSTNPAVSPIPNSLINSAWNGGGGNWWVASDWTPNGVPNNGEGNTYQVTIDSGGTDSVDLAGGATIASLVVGGTTGSSRLFNDYYSIPYLEVTGATTINRTGSLSFGGYPRTTVGSTLNFDGGLTNSGTIYTGLVGGGGYAGGNTVTVSRGFTNDGSLIMYGSGQPLSGGDTLNVTGTLTNNAGASLHLSDYSGVADIETLSNSGSVYFDIGTTLNVSGTLTNNAGAILHLADSYATVATLRNSGSVDILGLLNLTASQTDTNSGNINVEFGSVSPGTLKISASAVTLSGSGKVILLGNAFGIFATTITAAASTDILTSANTIEGSGNIGNSSMGFVNTGTVLANQSTALVIAPSSSGFNNKGTLNVSAGDTLQIIGPAGSFLNLNSATGTLTGGSYLVSGTLNLATSGQSNDIKTNAASITLTGTSSEITDGSGANALAPFASNAATGKFSLSGGQNFAAVRNFTNNGTLTIGSGSTFKIPTFLSLTNFSGTTLTGGTYNVAGALQFGPSWTTLVTNAASITLTGAGSQIINLGGGNILANFATNAASGIFALAGGRSFTTAGNFTNNGTLTVGSSSKFDVNGNLTNLNSTTSTLTGGTYNITGTLQFNGADIVTNAANITLKGAASQIINQTNGNGLANLATNAAAGSFTLAGNRSLTTAGFSNAGTLLVSKGSTLTVGANGKYTQTGGKTTVDGTLKTTSTGTITISGGSVFGNGGTFSSNLTSSGTINIGDAVLQAGMLSVAGTYAQAAGGSLVADIGGLTKDTQYDQLDITGKASLNGALKTDEINGFLPKMGETFDILNFSSETGKFSSCNGHAGGTTCSINGSEHFLVEYNANNVTLDVVAGAAGQSSNPTPEPSTVILFGTALVMAAHLGLRKVVCGS
jgi:hypothetical protein